MTVKLKNYETIGACGIDCGLCPRYYINGDSACPGCGGADFFTKHPSCGVLSCCVKKNGLEVCAQCIDFSCKKFDAEKDGYDSFVTHKKMLSNINYIRNNGIENFIIKQRIRIDILKYLIDNHDDGRSKNLYCISCALLPVESLKQIKEEADSLMKSIDHKQQHKRIRDLLTNAAIRANVELKLKKKA